MRLVVSSVTLALYANHQWRTSPTGSDLEMAILLRRMAFPHPRFDAVEIGKRMRAARRDQGFEAVEDFAAKIGVGKDAWYRKEQGKSPFTMDELSRACDLLRAPSLFPFLTWSEAFMVDRHLGRELPVSKGR